jgi:hypothetical protein
MTRDFCPLATAAGRRTRARRSAWGIRRIAASGIVVATSVVIAVVIATVVVGIWSSQESPGRKGKTVRNKSSARTDKTPNSLKQHVNTYSGRRSPCLSCSLQGCCSCCLGCWFLTAWLDGRMGSGVGMLREQGKQRRALFVRPKFGRASQATRARILSEMPDRSAAPKAMVRGVPTRT